MEPPRNLFLKRRNMFAWAAIFSGSLSTMIESRWIDSAMTDIKALSNARTKIMKTHERYHKPDGQTGIMIRDKQMSAQHWYSTYHSGDEARNHFHFFHDFKAHNALTSSCCRQVSNDLNFHAFLFKQQEGGRTSCWQDFLIRKNCDWIYHWVSFFFIKE